MRDSKLKPDFSGWATKHNIRCRDGRTIMDGAFKDCDGKIVPLVWMHQHNDPFNVLGHALLEARPEGIYTYGFFNDTERAIDAKKQVAHRDITRLSIWANNLKQRDGDVFHGDIKEVSLVLAGANPGAVIENPILAHTEEEDLETAIIYSGEDIKHEENEEKQMKHKTPDDIFETFNDDQKELLHALVEEITAEEVDEDEEIDVDEAARIYESMNEEQQELFDAVVGAAVAEIIDNEEEDDEEEDQDLYEEEDDEADDTEDEDENNEEEPEVKHNLFDKKSNTIAHTDIDIEGFAKAVFADTKKYGTFKDAFLAHADTYGLKAHPTSPYGVEIDALFPDLKAVNNEPTWIRRDADWVSVFMGAVHRVPFARIKMLHADLTDDEARARGYYKTKLKKEEVFTLLKRSIDPQTVYKKQKMDRDDVVDITTFDVVAWLRKEMRMMLEEEIARACLIGDGRNPASDDKISEDHIKPVMNDAELYTITVPVAYTASMTDDEKGKMLIKAVIKARKNYKGSGNPIMFTTEDQLTDLLLMEDGIGHALYETTEKLATKLRVSRIVTVPVMEGQKTKSGADLAAVIVNPKDYTIGADKGGAITGFDDFDIDYNQMKYLIETRISGALTVPFSAMVIETTTT